MRRQVELATQSLHDAKVLYFRSTIHVLNGHSLTVSAASLARDLDVAKVRLMQLTMLLCNDCSAGVRPARAPSNGTGRVARAGGGEA